MKYALIIIDGAADVPLKELGDRTPLETADTPHAHSLARSGTLGLVRTCPASLDCGSDVAIMSVLGYNPARYYTGRASLEAAAKDVPLGPSDWVFRTNIVTVEDGLMKDHSADNINQADADRIIALLNRELGGPEVRFYSGVSYRNLMVVRREMDVETDKPHDILDRPTAEHLPRGADAPFLIDLQERGRSLLERERVNSKATGIWFWGQGKKPALASFRERFGVTAAAITAVDLVRGIAKLSGWDVIEVPGATAYFDTNYRGKGEYAIRALEDHDLVCVHVEAPDEAGHKGDAREKVRALENVDRLITGPLLAALRRRDAWRILLLPDHPTPCPIRTHTHEPVPYVIAGHTAGDQAGSDVTGGGERKYCERDAKKTGVFVEEGHRLMEMFIRS